MNTTYTMQRVLIKKVAHFQVMNTVTGKMHSQWTTYEGAYHVTRDLNRIAARS